MVFQKNQDLALPFSTKMHFKQYRRRPQFCNVIRSHKISFIFTYFIVNYLHFIRDNWSPDFSPQNVNTFAGACLSVCKLVRTEMLFLHLFLLWRGDPQSCTRSVVEAKSSPCSPQAFAEHMGAHKPTAASHHQKTSALLKDVKSWKLPMGSTHKHPMAPIWQTPFPFFPFCFLIQQIHFVPLSGSKLVARKTW